MEGSHSIPPKELKKNRDSQKFLSTVWSEEYGIMGSAYYKNATEQVVSILK